MTPEETQEVLKMVARFDRRTTGVEDLKIWCAALTTAGVTVEQAIRAIVDHYTQRPDDYLQVGHIVQAVKLVRSEGLARSAAIETAALSRLDVDAPDYATSAINAIRMARAQAARGTAGPSRAQVLPSGAAGDRATDSRGHRRRCREHIAAEVASRGFKDVSSRAHQENVPPAIQAARERARADKDARRRAEIADRCDQPLAGTLDAIANRMRSVAPDRD